MDVLSTPEGSAGQQASAARKAVSGELSSAPAVPTAILRQLTEPASAAPRHVKAALPPHAPAPRQAEEADTSAQLAEAPAGTLQTDKNADLDPNASDPETDKAVDDIVAQESDAVLAAEDAQTEQAANKPATFGQKCKDFFYAWWHSKWARRTTILVVLAGVAATALIPVARYAVLNGAGIRASVSVVVLDDTTQLPLKNVTVSLAGQQATTNINGVAKVQHLRLGPQLLSIKRLAFAPITQRIVVGWGSNPLGNLSLKAAGVQYTINVIDYVSGKPLPNVEANSNGIEALSDKNGKIILTVDNKDALAVPVAIILSGYRTEQLSLAATPGAPTAVQLITGRQDVFISKQSGKYDLYKVDVDGKNKQVLLAGTGNENGNISLAVSPAGDEAALVSTRDNKHDSDGYLLTTLTLVNIASGNTATLDHAEQIQLVDWTDNRLLYDEASAGASAASSFRYHLISYDYSTASRIQLATANQFNGVLTADGIVYYAIAATDPSMASAFVKVRPDGTSRQTIYGQEVWSVFRTDYNTLSLQTPSGWYTYSIQSGQLSKSSAPSAFVSRVYVDAANGQQSLWVDTRDGQGVLLSYNLAGGKDTTLQTQDGLTYPVRWLNATTVVYSVVDKTETADYVLSLVGGKPQKITDVTHIYGIIQGS